MNKICKVFNFEVKQIGLEEDRMLGFTGSTESEDRDGDIIEAYGWDLTDYINNPVIMGFHEYDKFPYAKSTKTYIDYQSKELKFEVKFPTISELTSFPGNAEMIAEHAKNVDMAYNMYKNGYMRAVSVGFIGKEAEPIQDEKGNYKGRRYKKQSLLELSLVPVPSNPTALMEARSKGFINDNELKIFEESKDIVIKPGWDETETSFRFRVRDPGLFQERSFRTVPIKKDKPRVNSVMGRLKDEDTMTIQSVMFPKEDGWDLVEAKTWLKKHEDLTKGVDNVEQKEFDHEEKRGASISAKNMEMMQEVMNCMKEAMGIMEQMMSGGTGEPPEPPEEDGCKPKPKSEEIEEVKIALEEIKSQVLLLCQKDANEDINLDAIEFPKAEKDAAHNELEIKPEELKELVKQIIKEQIKGGK